MQRPPGANLCASRSSIRCDPPDLATVARPAIRGQLPAKVSRLAFVPHSRGKGQGFSGKRSGPRVRLFYSPRRCRGTVFVRRSHVLRLRVVGAFNSRNACALIRCRSNSVRSLRAPVPSLQSDLPVIYPARDRPRSAIATPSPGNTSQQSAATNGPAGRPARTRQAPTFDVRASVRSMTTAKGQSVCHG